MTTYKVTLLKVAQNAALTLPLGRGTVYKTHVTIVAEFWYFGTCFYSAENLLFSYGTRTHDLMNTSLTLYHLSYQEI